MARKRQREEKDTMQSQDQNVTNQTNDNQEHSSAKVAADEKEGFVSDEPATAGETVGQDALLQQKYNELNDKYLRLVAEFDNYRKRTLKERMELIKSGGEDLLKDILPVVDDLERALKNIETSNDIEAVKTGIMLIYGKFKEFLKQKGISEIEALHQDFDIDKHEAVTKIPSPSEELKGKVVDVVKKGYVLNDKVIRYAQVVIGE